jgi:hypothetical protein
MNFRTVKTALIPVALTAGALVAVPAGSAHSTVMAKYSPCTSKQSASFSAAYTKWQKKVPSPTTHQQLAELAKLTKQLRCEPRG